MENAFITDRVVIWRPIDRHDAAERIHAHRRDRYCKMRHYRLETTISSPGNQVVYCIRRAQRNNS